MPPWPLSFVFSHVIPLFPLRFSSTFDDGGGGDGFCGTQQVQETAGPVQPAGGGVDSGDKSRPFVQDAVPVGDGMEGGSAPPRPAAVADGAGGGAVQDDGGLVSRARVGGRMRCPWGYVWLMWCWWLWDGDCVVYFGWSVLWW